MQTRSKRRWNPIIMRSVAAAATALFLFHVGGCGGIRLQRNLAQTSFDWVTYGGSPSRTNQSSSVITPPLKTLWEYDALGGIAASPLVKDSVVLVSTLRGELHAVNMMTGDRLGYAVLESAVAGTPVWDGGFVYAASAMGTETVVCLAIRDGGRKWSAQYGPVETSPLLIGEFLYVVTLDGTLVCLKKVDGTEFWKFEPAPKELRKPVRSSPASDGEVIAYGSDDGWIYAVERLTGTLRWKFSAKGSVFAPPIIAGGLCIVGTIDGLLYAIDVRSGALRWKYESGSRIFAPAASAEHRVFIGATDGTMTALSLENGTKLWSFPCRSIISCAPLIAGDILYVGSQDRTLYALRAASGEKFWQMEVEGRIKVSPVIWGSVMILAYEDKYLMALNSEHK